MEAFTLILAGILILFVILCLSIAALLYVSGVLKPIDVGAGTPPIGQAVVAYKFAQGPYKYAGNLFTEVCRVAPDHKCLGIYYDNPNEVPSDKCRYIVGAVLSEGGVKVEPEVVERMTSEDFKIIELPALTNCVKTSFPYVNTLSIMIAVMRVYPKMNKYIKEHKLCAYPMLEIYEPTVIHFMAPLSQQEQFFAKEALECIPEEYQAEKDESSLDISARSSPAPSSRCSRSVSSFSHSYVSSRYGDNTYTDDESDTDNKNDEENIDDSIQDDEVSSSIEVRPSKACTNLLEETDVNVLKEEEALMKVGKDDSVCRGDESGISLQDSGICSGRTSAIPTETESLTDVRSPAGADGNDSSSSFEEINMEQAEKETASLEGSNETKSEP
ncbi:testis-expressed protein 264-like [Mercenaria mercenaria]|uniref:testis-expressed protein 264-like n=1 Tax=Mercenaria mercenaria TaxID=6596 RepID=UPI00234EFF5D|nr:testis-expressed protein 264-like [Mercenaria mercenaria]